MTNGVLEQIRKRLWILRFSVIDFLVMVDFVSLFQYGIEEDMPVVRSREKSVWTTVD